MSGVPGHGSPVPFAPMMGRSVHKSSKCNYTNCNCANARETPILEEPAPSSKANEYFVARTNFYQ